MASIALDIPEDLFERLRRQARESQLTIREVVLTAIERELERWEFREHLATHPTPDRGIEAAQLIRGERRRREDGDY